MSVDPLADAPLNVGTSPYAYVWNNPMKFVDPTGMHGESADDHIYLNSNGDEIARVTNEELGLAKDAPDRFFVETTTGGEKDFLEVNSPLTVKGDDKEGNKWDGSILNIEVSSLQADVDESVELMKSRYISSTYAAAKESRRGGEIDYVADFTDGTIHMINGVGYNSHEGLNLKWGMAMKKLGFGENVSVLGAESYHSYRWHSAYGKSDPYSRRVQRTQPTNEWNHNKAIRKGHSLGSGFTW